MKSPCYWCKPNITMFPLPKSNCITLVWISKIQTPQVPTVLTVLRPLVHIACNAFSFYKSLALHQRTYMLEEWVWSSLNDVYRILNLWEGRRHHVNCYLPNVHTHSISARKGKQNKSFRKCFGPKCSNVRMWSTNDRRNRNMNFENQSARLTFPSSRAARGQRAMNLSCSAFMRTRGRLSFLEREAGIRTSGWTGVRCIPFHALHRWPVSL